MYSTSNVLYDPVQDTHASQNWKVGIQNRANLLNFCVSTESFGAIDCLIANDTIPQVDHTTTRSNAYGGGHGGHGGDNDRGRNLARTKEKLMNINLQTAEKCKEGFENFKTKVERLKGTRPDPPTWKSEIKDSGEILKSDLNEKVDAATNEAIATIDRGIDNEEDKHKAADSFSKGQGGVGTLLNVVIRELSRVLNSVAEFVRGIWNQLGQAWETVKDGFKAASNFIKKGLGFVIEETRTLSQHSAFAKINSELGFILDELTREELDVDHLSVQRTADGWQVYPKGRP
ncbi:hypothetical protein LT330_007693 [Penicillium expansum]|nr:hypothetical protein LT330_007693 [Penicillium expansum]